MTNKVCKISLFSAILACVSTLPGVAAVKTNNSSRSYAGAYQQVNTIRAQQEYLNSTTNAASSQLPVTVDDENLARSILNSESGAPSVSDLEACKMIYLNGNFKWGVPEYGVQREPQCLAVVELRDANTNAILASTTVAAGQSIKCNIDSFPESSYNWSALSKIKELPSDVEPTMDDVVAVMNEEQKQNAGLKIAAGAIIAGVAGNLLAPKDASANTNDKIPLGTGKTQLRDTAIGAVAGAGIMAASSYSGKVAGDTIKSTAVNAASGMVIGNMMAGANGGNSVIATVKCSLENGNIKHEYDCIVGKYQEYGENLGDEEDGSFYIIKPDGTGLRKCSKNEESQMKCDPEPKKVGDIEVALKNSSTGSIALDKKDEIKGNENIEKWKLTENNIFTEYTHGTDGTETYYRIKSAKEVKDSKRAYALFESGTLRKAMGYTMDDWTKELSSKTLGIYERYTGGGVGEKIEITVEDHTEPAKPSDFEPSSRDADDGALVDLSNQARAKGTIAGAALGGAGGGLAGYAGAKNDITERWLAAKREYEASLNNFICATGSRFLSYYNDYAEIPALKKD